MTTASIFIPMVASIVSFRFTTILLALNKIENEEVLTTYVSGLC